MEGGRTLLRVARGCGKEEAQIKIKNRLLVDDSEVYPHKRRTGQ